MTTDDAPDPDRSTRAVYEQRAADWVVRRAPSRGSGPVDLAAAAHAAGQVGPIADLGCGPGWFLPLLGPGAIALDNARAMLDEVAHHDPSARCVQAELGALPLRRGSLGGAYAGKSWVHLARSKVPAALAEAHAALAPGAPLEAVLFGGDEEHAPMPGDEFAGRWFSHWPEAMLRDVLTGGGFTSITIESSERARAIDLTVRAVRARTLPDIVGPRMRLLVVGLNPSLRAADAGIGFVTPGNRFWPAALEAGIVSRDRDPRHALRAHGVGMTDLVKRATARVDEVAIDEHRSGRARLERLVTWLQPRAVCIVGLAGWRAAVDRRAVPGVQDATFGGRPVYLMGSTSGLNAHSSRASAAADLRAAAALADRSS